MQLTYTLRIISFYFAVIEAIPTKEWILYTLFAVGCLIIIAISNFVCAYRKRLSVNVRRENGLEEIEIRQEHVVIYDEIDDSLVGLNKSGPRASPHIRNTRAIVNDITEKKYSDQEDNSSYLDPYFAVNETESQNSLKESSSSLSSSVDLVVLDQTEYLNPYQPLLEREQHVSDGYEITIHVHHNSDSLSESESTEDGSSAYTYAHVYQQLHQDQNTNTHVYEKVTPKVNKLNLVEENETERCGNQVSADKYDINSSELLYVKETDKKINEHVFFVSQTIADEAMQINS